MSKLRVLGGDITVLDIDVVVNATNSQLSGGGGVDGAIHRAGGPQIAAACGLLRETTVPDGLPAGDAIATTAGRMAACFIVHTVGPAYFTIEDRSPTLRSAYGPQPARRRRPRRPLGGVPLISSGIYGWPSPDAAHHAITALRASTIIVQNIMIVAFSLEAHEAHEALRQQL